MSFMRFIKSLWVKVEGAVGEVAAHFIVSVAAIAAITATERLLHLAGLEKKPIPVINVSLSDWMLGLDVLAATAILVVGLIKALRELMK